MRTSPASSTRRSISLMGAVFLVCLSAQGIVEAAPIIVYESGAPVASSSNYVDGYFAADDFVVSEDTWLTGSTWSGDSWIILSNLPPINSGDIDRPNGVLDQGTFVGASFDHPVLVQGGERYWLAVFDGTLDDPC